MSRQHVSGAVYKGGIPHLQGKTAAVTIHEDYVEAQFDDVGTGYGHGSHVFARDDFEGIEDGDLEDEQPSTSGKEAVDTELVRDSSGQVPIAPTFAERIQVLQDGALEVLASTKDQLARLADIPRDAPNPDIPHPTGEERQLPLPAPQSPLDQLAASIMAADRRLKQAIPVLMELRDLARVFAWGAVGTAGVGVIWLLVIVFR